MNSIDWIWLPGALLALVAGGYASAVGSYLAAGEKNRQLFPIGVILTSISLAITVAGSLLLLRGCSWGVWYSFLLPGVIGLLVIGCLLPIVYRRCRPQA